MSKDQNEGDRPHRVWLSIPFMGVLILTKVAWVWRILRWKTSGLAVPWYGHVAGDVMFALIVATLLARC